MKARALFLLLLVFLLVFAVACTVSTETMGGEGDTTDADYFDHDAMQPSGVATVLLLTAHYQLYQAD